MDAGFVRSFLKHLFLLWVNKEKIIFFSCHFPKFSSLQINCYVTLSRKIFIQDEKTYINANLALTNGYFVSKLRGRWVQWE